MQTSTLLFIVLALLVSVAIAFFQYFYKTKKSPKIYVLLFFLKTMSLFLIGLLFINPKITSNITENIKPVLTVLVDNSLSTEHFKEATAVKKIVSVLKSNAELNQKFSVDFFSFGDKIKVLDSLSFNETKTDIHKAITSVRDLYKDKINATVLLSDGNQTIGNDYEFMSSEKEVYPVVLGDTTQFQDVKIAQLNVNKYAYIKNQFPVEVLLFYDGNETVSTVFNITQGGKNVFTQKVSFSPNKKTKTIIANLKASEEGVQYFTAGVRKIEKEKNTKNNYKSFAVEVIDEQTKVLVLASILHPDLGALKKAITSNKQRSVEISLASNFKGNLDAYQLVIFYQPNASFKRWMTDRKANYILITGTKTDWNFVNSLDRGIKKEAINQSENYSAAYNVDFATFLQKDIQFNDFHPLADKFGTLTLSGDSQTLLYQKLKGITTSEPLIATFENNTNKWSAILGEGIWKWRSASFLEENSFEPFDEFIANLVQYTVSNKKRKRLSVNLKSIYPANSTIDIAALYLDKNYQFDNRASLQITVINTATKERKLYPFSLVNNSYKVSLEGLQPGNYSYSVTVNNQNVTTGGRFKVTAYQVEEQFVNADYKKLARLAVKTKGKIFYKTQVDELIDELLANKQYYKTQKVTPKEENLINWQWLLFVIVALLTVEWFVRKYIGKL